MPRDFQVVARLPGPVDLSHQVWQQFNRHVIEDNSTPTFISWCKEEASRILRSARLRHAASERLFRTADPKPEEMMDAFERLILIEMIAYSKSLWAISDTCNEIALRLAAQGSVPVGEVFGRGDWINTVFVPISACTLLYEQDTIDSQLANVPTTWQKRENDPHMWCPIPHCNFVVMQSNSILGVVAGEWIVSCVDMKETYTL